jgi:hypothetical protein
MTREQNVRSILESNFAGFKDEIIDVAVKNIMALSENERETIDTSEDESKDQSVEWYCTDCPYFQFTGEPSADWYGTRCNKDNHEASPSMMAIEELNKNCPLNRG